MGKINVSISDGAYRNDDAVENVIAYILRHDNMTLAGGLGIKVTDKNDIAEQFHDVKRHFNKFYGKQIFHIVFSLDISFHFDLNELKYLAYKLAAYFGFERQVVFAIHFDTDNVHIHMGINTVSFLNGVQKNYFELEDIKIYAKKCLDEVAEKVWFKKNHSFL